MSAKLVALASFPLPNYLTRGDTAHDAHRLACDDTRYRSPSGQGDESHTLKLLADAIYAQAVRCGEGGISDYSRTVIVADLLHSFVELLNYERGGWDGGTCDSWARAVGEYIGQPLD